MKKIGIIDYDAGNLFSLENALKYLKFNYVISDDEKILKKCSHIILPGVGAFASAIKNLKKKKLDKLIKRITNEGTPLLGICLGMQLLFETSNEFGNHKGLNLIKGNVKKIESKFSKLPIVGWFKISVKNKYVTHKLNNEYVYLVHSYECIPEDNEIECSYYTLEKRKKILCSIQKNNIFAVQFHPEKSHFHGLNILKSFYDFRKK